MPAFRTPRLPAATMLSFALPLGFLFFNIFCPGPDIPKVVDQYKARTSPENVIDNLALLYQRLDANEYDSTLASNYVFRFQQQDIASGSPDSLVRAEEIGFAQNLFSYGNNGNPPASKISLAIAVQGKDDDNRIGHSGWRKYTVNTALIITYADANQIQVNSPATFFFRQDPVRPDLWVLAEWQDQPGSTGSATTATAGHVRQIALGQIAGVPPGPAGTP